MIRLAARIPARLAQVTLLVLFLGALVTFLILGAQMLWQTDAPLIVRDAVMVVVADRLVGKPIPLSYDYTGSVPLDPESTYDIMTNSTWLLEYTLRIIPFMSYEDVTFWGRYPNLVAFVPMADDRSLHVAGTAVLSDAVVALNERYLTDPRWSDQAEALAVLTHELIHIQLGVFGGKGCPLVWEEASACLESATESATVEVLAALCNYGDGLACQAFWGEVKSLSGSSLRWHLRGHPGLYQTFMNWFVRDGDEERAARKSMRHWSGQMSDLWDIVDKYGRHPWEAEVLPGLHGQALNTQQWAVPDSSNPTEGFYLMFNFDDTAELLGLWRLWLLALS